MASHGGIKKMSLQGNTDCIVSIEENASLIIMFILINVTRLVRMAKRTHTLLPKKVLFSSKLLLTCNYMYDLIMYQVYD